MNRLALMIIRALTPRSEREWVLGDTIEEFEQIARSRGRQAAQAWLRRETCRLLIQMPAWTLRGVVSDFRRDIPYAARLLIKSPGFTFVATAALAVGIGANLTIFGFVNAFVWRPPPAVNPHRLIRADAGGRNDPVPYDDYIAYRDRNQTLSHLTLFHWGGILSVRVGTRPSETIHVMPVTGNYFEMLGVKAAIGRTFTAADDRPGAAGAAVLSDEGWKRHFDANPEVVGQTILINGSVFTVLGVTPPSFTGTVSPIVPRIYATWHAVPLPPSASTSGLLMGRLRDGVDLANAQADAARVATQLRAEGNPAASLVVREATNGLPSGRGLLLLSSLFMVVVGAVLWVACSNIAILQLARTGARRREMAIRLALGATRFQLLRQLLVENMLLASISGICALGLALATGRWLTQFQPPVPMPLALSFYLDWRVTFFAVGITIVATLLTGLSAAIDSRRTGVTGVLLHESSGSTGARVRRTLVATQVAMSTVLLVVAVALGRTVSAPPDRGLVADDVLMATMALPHTRYSPDQSREFFERLLSRLESHADVTSATLVETIPVAIDKPLSGADISTEDATRVGARANIARVLINHISRNHFATLGIPLVEGRDFTVRDDRLSPPVVIANQTLARRLWPIGTPIGARVRIGPAEWATVVGIARDSKYESLDETPKPFIYRPFAQARNPVLAGTLLFKTSGESAAGWALVRTQVAELDPNLAVSNLNTFEDRLGLALLPNRAAAAMSGLLGLIALALGTIGTYSVMAFLVLQRRREIGIRVALGALPSAVLGMIARQGLVWTSIGLFVGALVSVAVLRLLQGALYGVSAADPVPLVTVLVLLGASGYAACALPTRRAAKGDPVAALRE